MERWEGIVKGVTPSICCGAVCRFLTGAASPKSRCQVGSRPTPPLIADDQSPTPLYCLPDDEERAVTTAQLLLDRGADRKVRNAQGQTPAAAARARGLDDAADVLQGKHDAG